MSLPKPQPSPTWGTVIANAIDARLLDVHTAMPAKVVRYDQATQTIDAKPTVKEHRLDENDEPVALELPVITNVPISFHAGGGFFTSFPLKVGDPVLLIFSEVSIDEWLEGDGAQVVTPTDPRRHHLTDPYAIPAARPKGKPVPGDPDAMLVGSESGLRVRITQSMIELGGADQAAALGDAIQTHLNNLKLWADTLILPSAVGPAGPPPVQSPSVPDVTSSKVKVGS